MVKDIVTHGLHISIMAGFSNILTRYHNKTMILEVEIKKAPRKGTAITREAPKPGRGLSCCTASYQTACANNTR